MSLSSRTLYTYGRRPKRMVTVNEDVWCDRDTHSSVFSSSGLSNDSLSTPEKSLASTTPLNNVKSRKKTKENKENEVTDFNLRRRNLRSAKKCGRVTGLSDSGSNSSTGNDGIFELDICRKKNVRTLNYKATTRTNVRRKPAPKAANHPVEAGPRPSSDNEGDCGEHTQPSSPFTKAVQGKNHRDLVAECNANFSDIDKYDLLVSSSPLVEFANAHQSRCNDSLVGPLSACSKDTTRGQSESSRRGSVNTSTPDVHVRNKVTSTPNVTGHKLPARGRLTSSLHQHQTSDSLYHSEAELSLIHTVSDEQDAGVSGTSLAEKSYSSSLNEQSHQNISECVATLSKLCLHVSSIAGSPSGSEVNVSARGDDKNPHQSDRDGAVHQRSWLNGCKNATSEDSFDPSQSLFDDGEMVISDHVNLTRRSLRSKHSGLGASQFSVSENDLLEEEEEEEEDHEDEVDDLSDILEVSERSEVIDTANQHSSHSDGESDIDAEMSDVIGYAGSAGYEVTSDVDSADDDHQVEPLTPPRLMPQLESFLEILTPVKCHRSGQVLTAREKVLDQCGQARPCRFSECIPPSMMKNLVKIGEGVYGEVFRAQRARNQHVALKIIPIEGDLIINDETQKTFEEILPEIVISKELSELRDCHENSTDNFVLVHRVACVEGRYPEVLLDEWDAYHHRKGSENDRPDMFPAEQLYIVFEFADAGTDLENFKLESLSAARSVLQQVAWALSVAELALEFEHRDLHWGNVLVKATSEHTLMYRLQGQEFCIPTHGVRVTIIDFTLSRLCKDGCTVHTDLSTDDTLFMGEGDYQFDIYRKMKECNQNNWEPFESYTNVLWLHYLADKLLRGKTYQRGLGRQVCSSRDFRLFMKGGLDYCSALDMTANDKLIKCDII